MTRGVKCWFITLGEPTGDQRAYAQQSQGLAVAMSFSQFESKLVDARSYLSLRGNYYFGSVRDLRTDSATDVSVEYIPLDLVEVGSQRLWSVQDVLHRLVKGGRFVFLGDYGAGKSMTLRELYFDLRKVYLRSGSPPFPIYINLRDHHGQGNPAEVLERHARNIGFEHPAHLVRAWRSGYAVLILDGFDEITTLGWVGVWKKLRDARYRSMEVIRRFMKETPDETGLALAGRAYFFDGDRERRRALSLSGKCVQLNLGDFTDSQVSQYLDKYGASSRIPEWLPSRPLLLGTLVARGLLDAVTNVSQTAAPQLVNPALGWPLLLRKIAAREADIGTSIDADTLLRILERIATKARRTSDGLGPVTREQLVAAFEEICGYSPDEQGLLLLQRLPGLAVDEEGEGARRFIDQDLVDACRAGDVIEFIISPYGFELDVFRDAECAMQPLGVSIAASRLAMSRPASGKLTPAVKRVAESNYEFAVLTADLIGICIELSSDVDGPVYVRQALIPQIELSAQMGDLSSVEFQDCYFARLEVDNDVQPKHMPKFRACYFGEVDGRGSSDALPASVFLDDCQYEAFLQSTQTSTAILSLDLPVGTRVLLTVLRKVFLQRGRGRKENALYRGLDHRARRLVPDVLKLLKGEGLVSSYPSGGETIWLPNRSATPRVRQIMRDPRNCRDSMVAKSSDFA